MFTLPFGDFVSPPVVHPELFASLTLDPSALCCFLLSQRSGLAFLSLFAWLFLVSGTRSRSLRIGLRVFSERLETMVPRGGTGPFWEDWTAD